MTSTNISNLFVQTNMVTPVNQTSDSAEVTASDFMEIMKKSDEDLMSIAGGTAETGILPTGNVNMDSYKTADNIKTVDKTESKEATPVSDKVKEEVKEFDEKVTKAVAKELDVSEEEVREAMEVLGLTAMDLTDKSNMAALISQITGQDSISLVMDDSFMKLNETVNEFFKEFANAIDVAPAKVDVSEFSDLLKEMKPVETEEVVSIEVDEAIDLSPEKAEQTVIQNTNTDEQIDLSDKPDRIVDESTVNQKSVTFTKENVNEEEPVEIEETDKAVVNADSEPIQTEGKQAESDNKNNNQPFNSTKSNETDISDKHVIVAGNESNNITFTVETKEVTLPNGQTVDVQRIIDQVVEQARTNVSAEKQSIEMLLNPEGLGRVYMEVSKNGNEVVAKFITENEALKEALESQLVNLKDSINNGETKVNAIEVSVGAHEFEKNLEEGQQQTNDNQEQNEAPKRTRSINLNNLDELSGLMTEEEQLVAQIMKDNGNTVSLQA